MKMLNTNNQGITMNVKVMTIQDALALAVEALNNEAEDTYEGTECDEPEIAEWIRKRETAASLLARQLKVLQDSTP